VRLDDSQPVRFSEAWGQLEWCERRDPELTNRRPSRLRAAILGACGSLRKPFCSQSAPSPRIRVCPRPSRNRPQPIYLEIGVTDMRLVRRPMLWFDCL